MFFVRNSASLYSLSFVCKNCLRCLVKCPPEINSPKQNLASTSRCKTYVPYTNKALHSYVNSSEYGWFSYWSFNLSTLCEFLTIWSNSSSSAIHSCHQSMLIFFISLSPGRTWLLITQVGYKNDLAIISIHSPNQEALEYPQKHASILHIQKLYQIRPAKSTRHDCLSLVQLDLVCMYFCSKWGLFPVFFGLHVVHQVNKGIYTIHPWDISSGYFLSSGTVSSLIAFLGFIPVIDDTVLFILFTILYKYLTETLDTFSGHWSFWASIDLNNSFDNSLLKASTKTVWMCLYFVVALQISTLCFSSNFITSFLNSDPLSHWNVFGCLNTPPFLRIASNTKTTLFDFLVLMGLATS